MQELVSQKVRRICDACGKAHEWELVDAPAETSQQMSEWYDVSRVFLIQGQPQKAVMQACSLACVPGAAVKLALPPTPDDDGQAIDLSTLRARGKVN